MNREKNGPTKMRGRKITQDVREYAASHQFKDIDVAVEEGMKERPRSSCSRVRKSTSRSEAVIAPSRIGERCGAGEPRSD